MLNWLQRLWLRVELRHLTDVINHEREHHRLHARRMRVWHDRQLELQARMRAVGGDPLRIGSPLLAGATDRNRHNRTSARS